MKIIKFLFLVLCSHIASAQEYFDGYIITLNNDTLHGRVMDRAKVHLSPLIKIRFKSDRGKKKKYKRKKLLGYKIDGKTFEAIWVEATMRNFRTTYTIRPGVGERLFLRVVEKGPLIYYQEEFQSEPSSTIFNADYLRIPGKSSMVRATQGIVGLKRKRLAEYFRDCSELVAKIENKEIDTIREIIDFYSVNCK